MHFVEKTSKLLGHHSWRCKKKAICNTVDNVVNNQRFHKQSDSIVQADSGDIGISLSPSNCCNVKCCCGKICKGLHDLKMHQRNCRVIKDLKDEKF